MTGPVPVCVQTWKGEVPCRTSAYCRNRVETSEARAAEVDRIILAAESAVGL